jgi:GT2 family glycosyltransferase
VESVYGSVEIGEPEVFVVDNGGTDGSAAAVADRFPRATVIRNEVNEGFARAVNRGLKLCRGRFAVLLNDDVVLSPDALSRIGKFLGETADAGIAGPQLLHADGREQNSIDNFPGLADQFLNKSLLRLLWPSRYPGKRRSWSGPTPVESVIGACIAIRADLIEKIGGLDERYFVFLEETDYCLRARQAGFRTYFLPGVRVRHDQGMTGTRRAPHRTRVEYLLSMIAYFRRHRGGWVTAVYVVGLFFKTLAELAGTLALCAISLFLWPSMRRRFATRAWTFAWLAKGAPESMGLRHARL